MNVGQFLDSEISLTELEYKADKIPKPRYKYIILH
jgi:hypothetical protein